MSIESDTKELRERIGNLVRVKFGDNYNRAFDHYDGTPKDGKISRAELINLLSDAAVGNAFTRGRWADAILAKLDSDRDGSISWSEFVTVFE
jgi:Ca2+-binding EF-hand superfamily protein